MLQGFRFSAVTYPALSIAEETSIIHCTRNHVELPGGSMNISWPIHLYIYSQQIIVLFKEGERLIFFLPAPTDVQTLPDATSPTCKIHPSSKIVVTFKPII